MEAKETEGFWAGAVEFTTGDFLSPCYLALTYTLTRIQAEISPCPQGAHSPAGLGKGCQEKKHDHRRKGFLGRRLK